MTGVSVSFIDKPFDKDPSLMKFIGLERKIEGVSHIFEAKLPSSSLFRSDFVEEDGDIDGVVID